MEPTPGGAETNPNATPAALPPPRWWQRLPVRLSLRTLLILILVLGGGLGWIVHRARVQRDAVAAIRAAGGHVFYESDRDEEDRANGEPAPRGEPLGPRWLVPLLGRDFLESVLIVELQVGGDQVNDALMAQVGRLGRLDSLNLYECKAVTDVGLAHLAGLTALEVLELQSTGITGGGFQHLAGMTRLRMLGLPGVPVADADLAQLRALTELEELDLSGPSPDLTDAGLVHLAGMTKLKALSLHSPRITSGGLASLRSIKGLELLDLARYAVTDLAPVRHLTQLSSLDLESNPITDAGLTPVRDFPLLVDLDLSATATTDARMAHLRGLRQLTHLHLDDTRITDAGVAQLADLRQLQQLYLDRTGLGDAALHQLARLDYLITLNMVQTQVTDTGLARVEGFKNGVHIKVGGPRVTDPGIAAANRSSPRITFARDDSEATRNPSPR